MGSEHLRAVISLQMFVALNLDMGSASQVNKYICTVKTRHRSRQQVGGAKYLFQ